MEKIKQKNSYPSFTFFIMNVCIGFIGFFMPWSSVYIETHIVGSPLNQRMGYFLSFWQTSFLGLVFRQTPCRNWIITQTSKPQGNILNLVQTIGFSFLSILIFLWFMFLWKNRKLMGKRLKKQLLQFGLFLVLLSAFIVICMGTYADCGLVQSIEVLDVHVFWTSLIFPVFSMLYSIIAILKSRTSRKEIESVQ